MRTPILCLLTLLLPATGFAEAQFWGQKTSDRAGTAAAALGSGHFVWMPRAAPAGPMVVVVSLKEQLAHAYRNGIPIGYARVSSGKQGHATPTGVFTTLQKAKEHYSSLYDSAPMPYMQRLTWDGIALHAGRVPGYPASHGCIRLPSEFARELFAASPLGMTVVVAKSATAPLSVARQAGPAAAPGAAGELAASRPASTALETAVARWEPDKSPAGPVSLLVNADRRLLVFRNGVEIGSTRVDVRDPRTPLGTRAFAVSGERADGTPAWTAVSIPGNSAGNSGIAGNSGNAANDKSAHEPLPIKRVIVPESFVRQVNPLLAPGSTLLITDATAPTPPPPTAVPTVLPAAASPAVPAPVTPAVPVGATPTVPPAAAAGGPVLGEALAAR